MERDILIAVILLIFPAGRVIVRIKKRCDEIRKNISPLFHNIWINVRRVDKSSDSSFQLSRAQSSTRHGIPERV